MIETVQCDGGELTVYDYPDVGRVVISVTMPEGYADLTREQARRMAVLLNKAADELDEWDRGALAAMGRNSHAAGERT